MIVRRFHTEAIVALATAALGVLAVAGVAELGFGWGESGPEAGYFPFWVGLVLIAASLWNFGRSVVKHRQAQRGARRDDVIEEPFLDHEQLGRLGGFLAALLAFVVVTIFLGIYVGSISYIAWSAWRQGGYRPPVSLFLGVAFAVALYVIFEVGFRVPLLKGPLEAALGIY